MLTNQRFSQALGICVGVWPAEFPGPFHAFVGEVSLEPANTILADLVLQRGAMKIFRGMLFPDGLLPQFLGDFRALGFGLRVFYELMKRMPFFLRIEVGNSGG